MNRLVRFALALLALVLCTFSVLAARQSGANAYYVAASALALIGVGASGFPSLSELSVRRSLSLRTWWGPALLSFGVLVLVGVLAVRFVLVPAA